MPSPKRHTQPNINELKDYCKWKEQGWSLIDYARHNLSPDLAIAVVSIFWPEYVVHDDCVFLSMNFTKRLSNKPSQITSEDTSDVERSVNQTELSELIPALGELHEWDNIVYFGEILTETWRCSLRKQFPDRKFQVVGEKDEEESDYIITFWQIE